MPKNKSKKLPGNTGTFATKPMIPPPPPPTENGLGGNVGTFNLRGNVGTFGRGGGSGARLTGNVLVLFESEAVKSGESTLKNKLGIRSLHTADFKTAGPNVDTMEGAQAMIFDEIGVAVVKSPDPDQIGRASALSASKGVVLTEPERFVYAINLSGALSVTPDYLVGYRDGTNRLLDKLLDSSGAVEFGTSDTALIAAAAQAEHTWGLKAVNALTSQYTGRGIRVAVLDTGVDLTHPDLAKREVHAQAFVQGTDEQDHDGHGTHCIGTACGPRRPAQLPGYGVAYEAVIFSGKVLDDNGFGSDRGILAGINWAIANNCPIISMSLGARVAQNEPFSNVYERVGRRALKKGTLIIAAAGNDSTRPTSLVPVSHPANCPSIMAVAAVDKRMRVAPFSNAGLNPNGGKVDIAAPGVGVYSSVPRPLLYDTYDGTSMATPHVAGCAALWAQAVADARGRALAHLLISNAQGLSAPSRDVGIGLVQAPA